MRTVHPVFLPEHPVRVMPAKLEGDVYLPPSKSIGHRALICAALSGANNWRESVHGLDDAVSQDISVTQAALEQITNYRTGDARLQISCGESGSTLRFLIPILLALGIPAELRGEGRLPRRPLREYKDIFASQDDVQLTFPNNGDSLFFCWTAN